MTRWPAQSKYRAVRTTVDGIAFASKKEAARYQQLRLLEMAGEIQRLTVHPRFELWAATRPVAYMHAYPSQATGEWCNREHIGKFTADFCYITKHGEPVVEDVKGGRATKTEAYRLRKRIFEVCHWPLTVTEV